LEFLTRMRSLAADVPHGGPKVGPRESGLLYARNLKGYLAWYRCWWWGF